MEALVGLFIIFVIGYFMFYKPFKEGAKPDKKIDLPVHFKTKVVGVTFKNEDGSDRQMLIKKHVSSGDHLYPKIYEYEKGKHAVAVLLKKDDMNYQIGNLSKDIAERVIKKNATIKLSVSEVTGGGSKSYGVNLDLYSNIKL